MSAEVYVCDHVRAIQELYAGLIDEGAWGRTAYEQLELLVERLIEGHRERHLGAFVELHNWLPGAVDDSEEQMFARDLMRDDARVSVARGHGYVDWDEVEQEGRTSQGDPRFEQAIEQLLAGTESALDKQLAAHPSLLEQRSHYGHRAQLLHYIASNGVENYRQRVPSNLASLTELLIRRGADPDATARFYGGDQTMRALLVTSGHPWEAGVTKAVVAVLDAAGAR